MNFITSHAFSVIILIVVFHMQAGTANASEVDINCGQVVERVSIHISFRGTAASASDVEAKIRDMENKAIGIGKELGIKEMKLNSQNFNLTSRQGHQGSGYQYNGRISFHVKPYDSAFKLADRLKNLGFQVSLNVSRYPNRNCPRHKRIKVL